MNKIISVTDELKVNSGDWISIIGENGVGKSTVLQGIMGLENTIGICEIMDSCGFVFQNPEHQFVTNKVLDELQYSLKFSTITESERQIIVTDFLEIFNLTKLQEQHPLTLSMGEKRRLSLATILITKPKILLLDEPTLGLDANNTFNILNILQKFQQSGMAILMVTHDPIISLNYASSIWHLDNKSITVLSSNKFNQTKLLNNTENNIKVV